MTVRLVNESQALLSMRESDFDTYSAYGEAVDNSIQAGATVIHIDFDCETQSRGFKLIKRVLFSDNGSGMDGEIMHRCLQLGYSSRFNDRSGIGRFGVGMTLGAIHECQRVDVYSKTKSNGRWQSTFIDLSQLQNDLGADVTIPEPVDADAPSLNGEHLGAGSGTVVAWSKYDRQPADADTVIEKTKVYMGRTFRRFIWDGVDIYVNGEKIFAIDPLYVTLEKTQFPEDAKARLEEPIVISWPVPADIAEYEGQKSEIIIKLSLLPEFLRKNQ